MRALGIDVGVTKGLDAVLLGEDRVPAAVHPRIPLHGIEAVIASSEADIVAIDSPPGWATRGGSRQTERELRWFGIQSYGTPSGDRGVGHSFYAWMRVGFEVFRIAERCGYPRFGKGKARGMAIEVFPHASAVVLAGCLPHPETHKGRWRAGVLAAQGVAVERLRSGDQIDAALAALTGLYALAGRSSALGDPTEGVIVLPTRTLPATAYRRCRAADDGGDPRLPGLSPCRCGDPGCDRLTAREFAPGHDAKRKAALWRAARAGHDATDELRRRGWELPPEMR